uniref:Uncharacterized protein n=1 Tax=Avena sativa TaxID=4498 RepID=A0ACD5TIF2_AVESA
MVDTDSSPISIYTNELHELRTWLAKRSFLLARTMGIMGPPNRNGIIISCVILSMAACCLGGEAAAAQASIPIPVPALYVLGDSLADAGTNNYLPTLLRANFKHNGVDYPGRESTGRFSNGKNFVDFLAEHLNLASPPPYLSICGPSSDNSTYLKGVNFASGGAGVSSQTNMGQCMSLDGQIDKHYSEVHASLVQQLGQEKASAHLGRSMFALSIGGNDILNYVRPNLVKQLISRPPQTRKEFIDSLSRSLEGQLQRMYELGMRKLFVVGAAPIGCCPVLRERAPGNECDAEANDLSARYNVVVASLLRQMSGRHPDFRYSLFDAAGALLQYIQRPQENGYEVVDSACCGLGDKNAMFLCAPLSRLCKNRTNHIFWDFVHPTETTAKKLTAVAFYGSSPFVTPRSVQQICDI